MEPDWKWTEGRNDTKPQPQQGPPFFFSAGGRASARHVTQKKPGKGSGRGCHAARKTAFQCGMKWPEFLIDSSKSAEMRGFIRKAADLMVNQGEQHAARGGQGSRELYSQGNSSGRKETRPEGRKMAFLWTVSGTPSRALPSGSAGAGSSGLLEGRAAREYFNQSTILDF